MKMRLWLLSSVVSGSLAVSAHAAPAGSCTEGQMAFTQAFHPMLRSQCAGCHDTAGPGPSHSVEDAASSYLSILALMNFDDRPASRLMTKVRERHWTRYAGGDRVTVTEGEVDAALQAWWDQGQLNCPTLALQKSPSVEIPSDINYTEFKLMTWDLSHISEDLTGVRLEMKVMGVESNGRLAGYLFKEPRLQSHTVPVSVQQIHLFVNDIHISTANNYLTVDQLAHPGGNGTLVSGLSMLVPSSATSTPDTPDTIGLGFATIEPGTAVTACRSVGSFTENVLPVVNDDNCYICHAGGPQELPGSEPARTRFSMAINNEQLCLEFLKYTNRSYPELSPIITLPLNSAAGHVRVIPFGRHVFPSWTSWITSEWQQ